MISSHNHNSWVNRICDWTLRVRLPRALASVGPASTLGLAIILKAIHFKVGFEPQFFLERQNWFSIDADAECERTMNSDWSDSCTIIFTETRGILTTYNRKEHYQWCIWHSKLCFICGFLIVYRMEFDKTSWPISRNSDPQNSAHFFVCLKLAPVQLLPIRSLSKLWEK